MDLDPINVLLVLLTIAVTTTGLALFVPAVLT